MKTLELTNDAKAILLLCGRFGKSDEEKPLALGEYNHLTDWMRDRNIRPSDLIVDTAARILEETPPTIDRIRVKRLLSRGATMALAIEKWTNYGIWVICRSDSAYPLRLKQHLKKQAPPILYGVGDIDLLSRGGLAVVGSRNIDREAELFTRSVSEESIRWGMQIISGGARGVDQISMLSALEAGGSAVGVLADSLTKAAVAGKYRTGILERRLTLVSSFYPDASFNIGNAMARNKYIYALADFALIINAETQKGGTWAGATEELKRTSARPVFVRNETNAPEGNQALLLQGALQFPLQPWGDNLVLLLNDRAKDQRRPLSSQRSLFGDPAISNVKEETELFQACGASADNAEVEQERIPSKKPQSVYEAVLPLLLSVIVDWQSPKYLAEKLNVRKVQLDDWLNRAIKEDKIEKKARPVQYRRK